MKKFKIITAKTGIYGVTLVTICLILLNACAPTKAVADKSGAQLWAENCQRCHNTASPSSFSPEQWETIGLHMQTRALITQQERIKIVDFLKSNP